MSKRLGIRFSLMTLLLVMTVAAVSVSHWLANRNLQRAQTAIAEHKTTIRQLRDNLGQLSVDDPAHVHVISLTANLERPNPPWKTALKWQVYLPPNSDWQVCWSAGATPQDGVPPTKIGARRLSPAADGKVVLTFTHGPRLEEGTSLVFRSNDDLWFAEVPRDKLAPFGDNDWIDSEIAGSEAGEARTESSSPSSAVRLLRQWNLQGSQTIGNSPGVAIWLEPVPKGRRQDAPLQQSVTKKAVPGDPTSPAPGSG